MHLIIAGQIFENVFVADKTELVMAVLSSSVNTYSSSFFPGSRGRSNRPSRGAKATVLELCSSAKKLLLSFLARWNLYLPILPRAPICYHAFTDWQSVHKPGLSHSSPPFLPVTPTACHDCMRAHTPKARYKDSSVLCFYFRMYLRGRMVRGSLEENRH